MMTYRCTNITKAILTSKKYGTQVVRIFPGHSVGNHGILSRLLNDKVIYHVCKFFKEMSSTEKVNDITTA